MGEVMNKRLLAKAAIILLTLMAGMAFAQDDEEMAVVNFIVLKDANGKPLRNASVVMHPVGKTGKQSRGGLELKCDAEGKASFDGVPYGKLRIQVLAPGFQTYGEDYRHRQTGRRDHGKDEAPNRAVLNLQRQPE